MLTPLFSEWLEEMKALLKKTTISIDADERTRLYSTTQILRRCLEIPPNHSTDYNEVADEFVRTIQSLPRGLQQLSAFAYIKAMQKSRDWITRVVADNIADRLVTCFFTGVTL